MSTWKENSRVQPIVGRATGPNIHSMLKGSKRAILRKVQRISIHGQLSLDVYFVDADDPDGQVSVARVGPEAVPPNLQPGDRIRLEYLVGVVTGVTRDE